MAAVDDYIFGNGVLHDRFRITTQVLAVLVSSAPRQVTITQLQKCTHRPIRELEKICDALQRMGLIQSNAKVRSSWTLACEPSAVTLEDVFDCVITSQSTRVATALVAESDEPEQLELDVDLLVMQAMMAVNQGICRQLRQFSLDRLRVSAAAKPPVSKQALRDELYDNMYDFEVNAWLIDTVLEEHKKQEKEP